MSIPMDLGRPREPFPSITVPASPASGAAQILLGSISTHMQRQMRWEGTRDQVTWGEGTLRKTPVNTLAALRAQLLKYKIQNESRTGWQCG